VLQAAQERIAWTFETFPRVLVSFSGGKDSTVMLHLVMEEAKKRNRKVGVLFIDWEAQYKLTIEHVRACFEMYADYIEPYWVALPFLTTNACSQFEPEWICWEQGKEDRWVRPLPEGAISAYDTLPFYTYAMTFEEFIEEFAHWYAQGQLTASFVGIRSVESLNRWRTVAGHGVKWEEDGIVRNYTNYHSQTSWNVYPLYDWSTEDIWTYHGKTGKPYNKLYDLMHKAGLSIHQMRICEPYGDEQRKGLWLYQLIEPETWGRVVARVAGANTGATYANEAGNIMGNVKITKPAGHTWKSFAEMLLASMPPKTADHYRDKIAVWLHWYYHNMNYTLETFPDELPDDTGSKDKPSWRRVCKVLLKNDFWCMGLTFSPTKSGSYAKYKKIMERRREQWGIFS
jgi:predicted phosphoadenosine phosphosulfate sulfurtransferase